MTAVPPGMPLCVNLTWRCDLPVTARSRIPGAGDLRTAVTRSPLGFQNDRAWSHVLVPCRGQPSWYTDRDLQARGDHD